MATNEEPSKWYHQNEAANKFPNSNPIKPFFGQIGACDHGIDNPIDNAVNGMQKQAWLVPITRITLYESSCSISQYYAPEHIFF